MQRHFVSLVLVFVTMFAAIWLTAVPAAARTTPFSFTYEGTETDTTCSFPLERYDVGKATGRVSDRRLEITNAGVATFTYLPTGLSVTQKYQVLFKNFNQVDNGDGTVSGDQTTLGSSTLYGPNGKVLLRSHGPMTIRLTLRLDPFEVVSKEILFEHGAHPSDAMFCQVLAEALGATV